MTKDEALKLCDYLQSNDASMEAQCEAAAFIREALAQPEQEPPPWWTAVEKILEEYGLQAIDFVADFNDAMKDASQSEQKPVATKIETQQFNCFHVSAEDFQRLKALPVGAKLYTAPPRRQPLTDEEIQAIHDTYYRRMGPQEFARAIEAAHSIGDKT